jgi:hypothetical protein
MRALISWDVDRSDPDYQRILIAIVDCFPAGKLTSLTQQTARADKITQKQFVDVNTRLQQVSGEYVGRMFYVLSLHSENDPIYGTYRSTSTGPSVVAVTPVPDGE